MAITRETLKSKKFEIPKERVELPEWGEGEYVWVYGLTAKEQNQHDASLMKPDWAGVSAQRAAIQKELLLVRCLRDDEGNQIFRMEDVPEIGNWPVSIFNRLHDVAIKLADGTTEANEEQAVKN